MAVLWPTFTTTPIFARPAIRFPASGTIGEIEVPLHITKLATQTSNPTVTEIASGPLIDSASNLGSGGLSIGWGQNQLEIISLEGFIDTPMVQVAGGWQVPGLIIDGLRVTYGEILAAYFEGRTSLNGANIWQLTYPRWFRDGFGRVYGDQTPTGPSSVIRMYDLTITRIEAVPGRNNFTMQLQVS